MSPVVPPAPRRPLAQLRGLPLAGRLVNAVPVDVCREGDIPFIEEKRSYAQGSVKTGLEAWILLF